ISNISTDAESVIFNVANHKTAFTYGAATITLNKEEMQLMVSYINVRKHLFVGYHVSDFVFVTKTGSRMSQSNFASALTIAFAQSGYSRRVSCTKVRKCAVTVMYKKHPD